MPFEKGDIETVLYNTESRQRLIDELEELECFMKQRYAELSSKDQSNYAYYMDANMAR